MLNQIYLSPGTPAAPEGPSECTECDGKKEIDQEVCNHCQGTGLIDEDGNPAFSDFDDDRSLY